MRNSIRIASVALFVLSWSGLGLIHAQQPNMDPSRRDATPRQEPRETAPPPRAQQETAPSRSSEQEKPPQPGRQESPRPPTEPSNRTHQERGRAVQQGGARPATRSAHIPDAQFKANFGRQHTFSANRVITQTAIVPGQTQFVMAGYTFLFLDPWPAEWMFADDCYIDFIAGDYFLFDVFHPGMRVALLVIG